MLIGCNLITYYCLFMMVSLHCYKVMRVHKLHRSCFVIRARYFIRLMVLLVLTQISAQDATSQWTQLARAGPGNYLSETGALAFRNGKLWFGRDKLYLSTDTGKTWTTQLSLPPINSSSPWFGITDIDFSDTNHGIVSDGGGVFLTSDGGQHWLSVPGAGPSWSAVLLDSENAGMFVVGGAGAAERATVDTSWQVSPTNAVFCVRTNHDRNKCYYMVDTFVSTGSGGQELLLNDLWLTTDRGQTWREPGGKFGNDCFTMAVDSCDDNILYVANENYYAFNLFNGYILRSADGGVSWDTVFTAPRRFLTGGIVVSTHGIYCQTMTEGVIRSTDQGATWNVIGGPSSVADSRTLTVVNDTTIIASDSLGNVWKFSDDTAIANIQIPAPVISPDTIQIGLCDSSKFVVATIPAACYAYLLDTMYLTGNDSGGVHLSVSNLTSSDSSLTIQASVSPFETGTFTELLHIRQRWGGLDYDDSAPVTFVVFPGPHGRTISPNSLDFGSLTLCPGALGYDTLTLRNDGCDELEFDGVALAGDTSIFFANASPKILVAGDTALIILRYQPLTNGGNSAILIVQTNDGNDTIPISARAIEPKAALGLIMDTVFATACDTGIGLLRILNPGCNPLILDSLLLDSGSAFLLSGSGGFPAILDQFQSKDVGVGLTAHAPGTASGVLHFYYRVFELNDTVAYDTTLAISGIIRPGPAHYELSDSSLAFGSVAVCADSTTQLTIYNDGCDTLRFVRYQPNGDVSAFGLGTTLPQNLPPGDSEVLHFAFAPDSLRNYLASLKITTNANGSQISFSGTGIPSHLKLSDSSLTFGNVALCADSTAQLTIFNDACDTLRFLKFQPHGDVRVFGLDTILPKNLPRGDSEVLRFTCAPDSLRNYLASLAITTNGGSSQIEFTATGIPDSPRVALATTTIEFQGAVANCGLDTSSVAFSNSSCAWIRVDSMKSGPSGIFSPLEATLPQMLSHDSSARLPFTFSPAASGAASGSATIFYSDANGHEHDTTIQLNGNGLPRAAFRAEIAPPIPLSAGVLDTVTIPLDLSVSNIPQAPQRGTLPMEFKIVCNTDVLAPINVEVSDQAIDVKQWNMIADTITIDISINLATFLAASQDNNMSEALRVIARPFVSDSLATDIALTSMASSSFTADCLDYSLSSSNASRFALTLGCGDSLLSRFMATHILAISSIDPNPAARTIEVGYSLDTTALDRSVRWYVFNARGTLASQGATQSSPICLSVSSLASGEYFLYLERGFQQTREEISRSFVVQH